jgi:hypothetical protein
MSLAKVPVLVHHRPENPRGRNNLEGKYFYCDSPIESVGGFSLNERVSIELPDIGGASSTIEDMIILVLNALEGTPDSFDVPIRHSKLLFHADVKSRPDELNNFDWVDFNEATPQRLYGPSIRDDGQKSLAEYDEFDLTEFDTGSQKYKKEAFITRISRFLFGE